MIALRRIHGESLAPAFRDGDFVISSRIPFLFRPPRPGEIVVFRHPHHGVLVKRVDSVDAARSWVRVAGSHPDSINSSQIGPVRIRDLLGKVITHIRKPRK